MFGISLFELWIPDSNFDGKLTLVMTSLLTVVVFHLYQQESLPPVGYLVKQDLYFIITYCFMFVHIAKTILVHIMSRSDRPLLRTAAAFFKKAFPILFLPLVLIGYFLVTISDLAG